MFIEFPTTTVLEESIGGAIFIPSLALDMRQVVFEVTATGLVARGR